MQQPLVTEVDAVEDADGDDRLAARSVADGGRQVQVQQRVEAFDQAVTSIRLPGPGKASQGDDIGDILSMLNVDDASEDVPTIPMPLAHSLPWPDLPRIFDEGACTSYWWTNTGAGGPLRGFTTDVGLAPSLMLTLMRPQFGGARRQ